MSKDLKSVIEKAGKDGCRAVDIADKNSMIPVLAFMQCCEERHLKPVVRVKFTIRTGNIEGDLALFAKNNTGYQEICSRGNQPPAGRGRFYQIVIKAGFHFQRISAWIFKKEIKPELFTEQYLN